MKKIILPLLLMFIFCSFELVEARIVVMSPQDMINYSKHIVIGTITEKNYSEDKREVTLTVDSVLKGTLKQKNIVFKMNKGHMYGGWIGFDFPDKGTKVMVILDEEFLGLSLLGDGNSVAVIEDNKVKEIYNGVTAGWKPEQYLPIYQEFLDKNKPSQNGIAAMLNIVAPILLLLIAFLLYKIYKELNE